jgi:SRSO17 transposase
MAERVCPGQTQQLHHFVSTSAWSTAPLEQVLRKTADALVGGKDAALIVDDTALPKQGKHSVGVKRQHCGVLGKQANCQVLVSLTLARKEVPVPIALRLYLPEDWAQDDARREAAKYLIQLRSNPRATSRWRRSTPRWPRTCALASCWPTPAMAVRQAFAPG